MIETVPTSRSYQLQNACMAEANGPLFEQWADFRRARPSKYPFHDPLWLRGYFSGQLDNLHTFLMYQSGSVCGLAPFLLRSWPLKWQVGEVTVAEPRLQRLRLLGGVLDLPEDEAAYDNLFGEIARAPIAFDAIHLEEVRVDSFLWNYLQTSRFIRRNFRVYAPDPPMPHLEARIPTTFDEYMKKFSGKSRSTLRRKLKHITDGGAGPARLATYTRPEDVEVFLDAAVGVSKKTYQWNLLQKGLSQTDLLKMRMIHAAEHGWLRSYILFCNEMPTAFFLGFQYGGTYMLHETGFDPDFSKHSVGTVLQLMIIQDLIANDRPDIFDLGAYGGWKEMLSTDSYLEGKMLLFRPTAYGSFVQRGHQACQAAGNTAAALLDRFHLKARLKTMIRNFSSTSGAAEQKQANSPAE